MSCARQPLDQRITGFVIIRSPRITDRQHRDPHGYKLTVFVNPAHVLPSLDPGQPKSPLYDHRASLALIARRSAHASRFWARLRIK